MPEGYASNLGKRADMNKGKLIEVSRNKKTNNSGVYIQGDVDGTGQTIEYYGVIQEIIEVRYLGWPKKKIVLFWCEWFDPSHRATKVDHQYNIIEVKHTRKYRSYDPFIIAQNAKQVYYASYPLRIDKADRWIVIKSSISSAPERISHDTHLFTISFDTTNPRQYYPNYHRPINASSTSQALHSQRYKDLPLQAINRA
ncbi:hypothetical protein RDI58_010464 [Solanum bulbocastanum]|uniref:DUF4216 domain-containing protein n=1 Tax=Solanum bulbocastanum TaxID=147425 RepID=A0AAN8YJI2_SOLBU